jgi:hypothetical protein
VTDNVLTVVKGAVRAAFGIRTALQNLAKTGPMVCEVQQHLAKFILPSIAGQMAETPWKKLSVPVQIDGVRPFRLLVQGAKARVLALMLAVLPQAREAGIEGVTLQGALANLAAVRDDLSLNADTMPDSEASSRPCGYPG